MFRAGDIVTLDGIPWTVLAPMANYDGSPAVCLMRRGLATMLYLWLLVQPEPLRH